MLWFGMVEIIAGVALRGAYVFVLLGASGVAIGAILLVLERFDRPHESAHEYMTRLFRNVPAGQWSVFLALVLTAMAGFGMLLHGIETSGIHGLIGFVVVFFSMIVSLLYIINLSEVAEPPGCR